MRATRISIFRTAKSYCGLNGRTKPLSKAPTPTDLGLLMMAEALGPKLRSIIETKNEGIKTCIISLSFHF